MDNEMRNSASIDEAFKAINTATGVKDVQELVKRFLTREQTVSQLLANVNDSDVKIEQLRRDNDYIRQKLQDIKIDTQAQENDGEKAKGHDKF